MAQSGDFYTVVLKRPHLEWGTYRYTNSRGLRCGEGYIPIPADVAYQYGIFNESAPPFGDIHGKNLFNCSSADGFFNGVLKAQGNQNRREYAKQFAGNDNLKAVGDWYRAVDANIGDVVKVTWVSDKDIVIEKI